MQLRLCLHAKFFFLHFSLAGKSLLQIVLEKHTGNSINNNKVPKQ
jgi:hypothetical protein